MCGTGGGSEPWHLWWQYWQSCSNLENGKVVLVAVIVLMVAGTTSTVGAQRTMMVA